MLKSSTLPRQVWVAEKREVGDVFLDIDDASNYPMYQLYVVFLLPAMMTMQPSKPSRCTSNPILIYYASGLPDDGSAIYHRRSEATLYTSRSGSAAGKRLFDRRRA